MVEQTEGAQEGILRRSVRGTYYSVVEDLFLKIFE